MIRRDQVADQAFVVRCRVGSATNSESIDGRIEHVSSGRALRFAAWSDMLEFMRRELGETEPTGPR
jgi:hypothetical protein